MIKTLRNGARKWKTMCACTAAKDPKDKLRNMGGWSSDDMPIVIDTEASRTINPFFKDVIDPKPYKEPSLILAKSSGRSLMMRAN